MPANNTDRINYVELPQPNTLLKIESLDYKNHYDYSKMHRHDYFEVMFIKQGGGTQQIDFQTYPLTAGDIFIIYPGQVHIMDRQTAQGLVIQFKKEVFEYIHPIRHYNLYTQSALYKNDADTFQHLFDMSGRIKAMSAADGRLSQIAKHKMYSYLQIILITLAELNTNSVISDKERNALNEYMSLITTHILTKKKVNEYAALLNIGSEKLNETCKKGLGKTALQLIHEELVLEIRRLLLLNEMSLKEISYHLNFDSPSNFSTFIKTATGLTPKELQVSVLEIYN